MSKKRAVPIILVASLFVLALGVSPRGSDVAQAFPPGKQTVAQPVTTIPYPGHLSDESGQGVADGAYDFSFALYSAETAGESLWSEVQQSIKVIDGGFMTSLGSVQPIPAGLLEGDRKLWLAVGVRGPGESDFTALTPRQALSLASPAAPASVNAGLTCVHDHWNEVWSGSSTGLVLNSSDSIAVKGTSSTNYGVKGEGGNVGVFGEATGKGTDSYGVFGLGSDGPGVYGSSTNGYGVQGNSGEHGVRGETTGDYGWRSGVFGFATGDHANGVTGWNDFGGVGVYGYGPNGYAGYFNGDVNVTGSLTKSSGGFKIDHPLDPENTYLNHSFVESPDMKNVYDGVVILDSEGAAWVELPEWFEALNKDFRYQLTPIGASAPDLYIAREIESNRFQIAGGDAGLKVSWQVTGSRHDAYAEAHPLAVEEPKPTEEQGTYLHPAEYGKPQTDGLDYQRNQPPEQLETGGE
jgi:hypothetical protein